MSGGLSPASSEQDRALPPEPWSGFVDPGEMEPEDESSQLGGDPTDAASQEVYHGGTADQNQELEAAVARDGRKAQPPEIPAFVGYCGMVAVLGASVAMTNPPGGVEEEELAVHMFFFFVVFLFGLGLIMFRANS